MVKSNDALYERVALVAKALKHRTPEKARAYFELETHVEQQPVEVVECFYNAELSGAQVRELRLKHGRISLAPFQSTPGSERYFVSLNTTKAVTLFDLTGSDERFPVSPLQWTKAKAVKKHYRAELVATDEEGTDEILLTPRDSSGNSFTVNLWLRGDRLLAVELNCAKCIRHPFLPYQPEHTIRQVDLRIRQTWRTDAAQLDHIELAYTLDYLNNAHAERVDTRAVLHLFDPVVRSYCPCSTTTRNNRTTARSCCNRTTVYSGSARQHWSARHNRNAIAHSSARTGCSVVTAWIRTMRGAASSKATAHGGAPTNASA
ncbi:MAG: hypothetical protein IPG74_16125 [Flavobacteriales bacterium]|nr:hypothetical protein [Flavobacteriales bacterium]